jgi:hypothetical protein
MDTLNLELLVVNVIKIKTFFRSHQLSTLSRVPPTLPLFIIIIFYSRSLLLVKIENDMIKFSEIIKISKSI